MILPATAEANNGLCAQCIKLSPAELVVARAIKGGLNPIHHAINRYSSLIDTLARDALGMNFGGIGDPLFEGIRFYSFETLSGSFNYYEAVERGSEAVDELELYLSAATPGYSLFFPVLTKLKSVAAILNSNGKSVFLGSWGMGPGEIGWLIRHLNDRSAFDRYLREAGITEEDVNVYNDAYARELHEAEQASRYELPIHPNA
jgi:hypothetical protein